VNAARMRPRLLDLFCGAGGCSVGYQRAGFDAVGVDREAHPDYPYKLIEGDALAVLADIDLLADFDAVHASPPCQGYTTMSNRWRGAGGVADSHDNLIAEVRHYLTQWGGAYVIENVPGAKRDMRNPVTLRGGMFGLGVDRPRLFETNFPVTIPAHTRVDNPVGVYGKLDGRRLFTRVDGSEQRAARTLEQGQAAMGIDWMQWHDLTEAIPPAYTEHIGRQLIEHIESERAA
jgi:DNA (cytosine-5)-methyltransferase 1